MSSVLKAYRKKSDFDVIDKAIELENKIIDYIYRDFVENTKLDNQSLAFIYDERKAIETFCRNIRVCLDLANNTYLFSIVDYNHRKSLQGQAIGWCSTLRQEIQKIIKKLKPYININKYKDINNEIKEEIQRIRNWRQSENHFGPELIEKEERERELVRLKLQEENKRLEIRKLILSV